MGQVSFSEGGGEWEDLPAWVQALLNLGYRWPKGTDGCRRIGLVSLPCDCPGAGLVALGSLVRDLERTEAQDVAVHFGSMLRYAKQYLDHCSPCPTKCDPKQAKCGYFTQATGRIRSLRKPHQGYLVSGYKEGESRIVEFQRGGVTFTLWPAGGLNYYVDGFPPPVSGQTSTSELPETTYQALVLNAAPQANNLRRSFSGLCLSGRSGGESETRLLYEALKFQIEGRQHDLASLLTIQDWSPRGRVSRATFFNVRTEKFDRYVVSPAMVVADGDASFLKVLGWAPLETADVLGVIHRTVDRDRLEAVGNQLIGLRQWYVEDSEFAQSLPAMPPGISLHILRRNG